MLANLLQERGSGPQRGAIRSGRLHHQSCCRSTLVSNLTCCPSCLPATLPGGRQHPGALRRPAVQHLLCVRPRRSPAGAAQEGGRAGVLEGCSARPLVVLRWFAGLIICRLLLRPSNACLAARPPVHSACDRSPQVHLFDIDIPGKITFKESLTLTPGEGLTVVDTEASGRGGQTQRL